MGPAILDDRLETLAFGVCNTDGVEGLSWAEVEQCTVGYNSTFTVGYNKTFQPQLGYEYTTFSSVSPSQSDF